jgi:hypothetical protein
LIETSATREMERMDDLSLPEIKSGRTDDAILPEAAWQ